MIAELTALITLLGRLTFDDLADFTFLIERELLNTQRSSKNQAERQQADAKLRLLQLSRKGIPYERLATPSEELVSAQHLAEKLSADEQRAIVEMANTLRGILQPIEKRRKRRDKATGNVQDVAKGRVEIKYIRIPVYDFDTGLRAVDENGNKLSRGPGPTVGPPKEIPGFGPYLYVRVWASGGGRDRNLSRHKSKYVGLKGLAMHLEERLQNAPSGSAERKALAEEIIDRYIAGKLHQWAREHYPDPDSEEPLEDIEEPEEAEAEEIKATTRDELVLPFHGQSLNEVRRQQLLQFFADEYQRRHGRPWRFHTAKLIRQPDGKYTMTYTLYEADWAIRMMHFKDRKDVEHRLSWIVKTAGDTQMTLDR